MKIFTKSLLTLVLLCIAGVVNAATETLAGGVDYANPLNDKGQVVHEYPYYCDANWMYSGVAVRPTVTDGVLVMDNSAEGDGNYGCVFIHDWLPIKGGAEYKIVMTYKTTVAGTINLNFGSWGAGMSKNNLPLTVSNEWQDLVVNLGPAGFEENSNTCHVNISCGIKGVLSVKKVEVYEIEASAPEGQLVNPCLACDGGDARTNAWDKQVIYNLSTPLTAGKQYVLKAKMKYAEEGEKQTVTLWTLWNASENKNQWGGTNDVQYLEEKAVTTDFADYTWEFTAHEGWAEDQFLFAFGPSKGTLYIDDVSLMEKGTSEELVENGTFDHWNITKWANNYNGPSYKVYKGFTTPDPNYSGGSLNIPDTDPIIVSAKSALLTAINKAKNTNLLGKTTASKNALAAAVVAGTALVGTEGGEVAEIDAAREAVLTAIYELQDRTAPTAEKEVPKGWKSVITNGNLEGKDMSCFSAKVADAKDATECETADYEGIDDFHALFVQSNAAIKTQDWSDQLFITATETIPAGTKIHVEFDYRSDVEATAETQSHNLAGQYIHYAAIGNVNFKPEWQHFNYDGAVVAECNGGDNNGGYKNDFRTIAFNLSKNGKNTKFFIDNVVFWIELPKVQKQVLENGDLEGEETSNYMVKVYPSSAIVPATLTEGAGKDGSKGLKIDAPKKVSQDWDSQFWILLPYESVPAGTSIKVKFDYKASAAASVDTQTHEAPGNYIHYAAIGTLNFTTDWKTFEGTFAVPSQCNGSDNSNGYKNNFRSIAFNLAKGTANDDVTFYFDNFSMTMDEEVADELTVVTGIKNVQPVAVKAGQYYDLLGRPVAQPRKGLYILNGQKVAVK